ncbi:hypothetical protein [Micromonospora chersina]|uniref:hypothetical protein n=1 Tax=Micromonospora chersina TaxID=47854 RepID=UPI003D946F8B
MAQLSLFGPSGEDLDPKPASDEVIRLRVLITVKAAPNPSEKYGETVCVAGVRANLEHPGWVRLYPINFRYLDSTEKFDKYDIVSVDAIPARGGDQRRESWRPLMGTLVRERRLPPWKQRRAWLDTYVESSMCRLNQGARNTTDSQSLALVQPREVGDLKITLHEGWTKEEQRKIDAYVNQLDLLDDQDRTPLEAPRFRGAYRYRCWDRRCRGHEQGLLDWEFVVLQRRLRHYSDEEARGALKKKFLDMMCAPKRDVAFYVGNQAKRRHVFSVLGVYYPER